MKHRREGRQRIRTRLHHFPHDVDLNGPCISQRHPYLIIFVRKYRSQLVLQESVRFFHRHATQVNRSQFLHVDCSVRRNGLPDAGLAGSPDVDDYLIARSQLIVGRCCHVAVRLKRQVPGIEDISSKYLILLCQFLRSRLVVRQGGCLILGFLPQPCFVQFRSLHVGSIRPHLLFILFLDSFRLFTGHSFSGQFHCNLLLLFPFLGRLFHIFYHLLVRHLRLCIHFRNRACHQKQWDDQ